MVSSLQDAGPKMLKPVGIDINAIQKATMLRLASGCVFKLTKAFPQAFYAHGCTPIVF
jgi:hypothetical protein